jgi:anti-sigma factor RsiW
MECKAVHKRLAAFIDGELEAPVREVVKTHLNLCSRCSIEYDRMKKTLRAARAWASRPLPQGFAAAVQERAERGELPRPVRGPLLDVAGLLCGLPRWSRQAVAVCLVLAVGLVLGHVVWPKRTAVQGVGDSVEADGAAQAAADPFKQNALETLATIQKLKVIQSMRQGTEEAIAEHNAVQRALAQAIDPELAGKVTLHQQAEALLAAGQYDDAEAILSDLEHDASYPLAVYAGLQRRFGQPVPSSEAVYAELLRPDVLMSPERLYRVVRRHSSEFARTYTEALEAGLKPFESIKLPESFWQPPDASGQ